MNQYSKAFLSDLFRTMLRIRLCEESFVEPILKGEIKCPAHLYSGEEAIAAGVCAALAEGDYVFGNHRSHGHYLAKGGDLLALIAEIYGKAAGCAKGRGGSMHVLQPDKGFIGAAPIVAGTISLALGAALATKIRQEDRVSVSFFGDGATGEGVLYESMNFAALNRLPMLFVCENNFYATHMPIEEVRPSRDIVGIAAPFHIKGFSVDGNGVLETYEIASQAVEACRSDQGPVFLECRTYRLRGHVGPDDNIQGTHTDIRPEAEIEAWKQKDPLLRFEKELLTSNSFSTDEIETIRQSAQAEIDEASLAVKELPYPDESELLDYVYKQ